MEVTTKYVVCVSITYCRWTLADDYVLTKLITMSLKKHYYYCAAFLVPCVPLCLYATTLILGIVPLGTNTAYKQVHGLTLGTDPVCQPFYY